MINNTNNQNQQVGWGEAICNSLLNLPFALYQIACKVSSIFFCCCPQNKVADKPITGKIKPISETKKVVPTPLQKSDPLPVVAEVKTSPHKMEPLPVEIPVMQPKPSPSVKLKGETFQEMMLDYLQSHDEGHIEEYRKIFLNKFPQLQKVIETINEGVHRTSLINSLYVLAGIKPVYVWDDNNQHNQEFFELCSKEFKHIKVVKAEGIHTNDYYLINETPLYEFDPRRFINNLDKNYQSLEAAVTYAFPNQDRVETDKLLSYLLGFGPTWEAYAGISCKRNRKYSNLTTLSVFSEEHYFQLGKVLCDKEVPRNQLVAIGQEYNLNLRKKEWPNMLDNANSKEGKEITKLDMQHIVDKVSFQTDYIQRGIAYRRRMLSLLGISEKI